MKVLKIAVDMHSGEKLHTSTIEVNSAAYCNNTLPDEGIFEGELVHFSYSDDLEPGPTEEESSWLPNLDPSDFVK